jgi:hypothetical protein
MTHFTRRIALALFVSLCSTLPAHASSASKDDAQTQANAAVTQIKKVGLDQAIKDINSGAEWKTKEMNDNVVDFKGVVLASSLNEKLRGKDTLESKDPSGKAFVKEFIATAQKGEGWVDYQFINPVSKKLEERSMFVKRAPGAEAFVAVAITKQ